MIDSCVTLMLLLLMVTHHDPSVAVPVIPYFTFSYYIKKYLQKVTKTVGQTHRDIGTVSGQTRDGG